jgi:hypothetical protein
MAETWCLKMHKDTQISQIYGVSVSLACESMFVDYIYDVCGSNKVLRKGSSQMPDRISGTEMGNQRSVRGPGRDQEVRSCMYT